MTEESLSEALGFAEPVIQMGMTHPAVRRTLRGMGGTTSLIVTLDDDRVRGLEVEIGLGHRGFEKEVESRDWELARPYVSRLGYAAGVQYELAYCEALESLAEIPLPERAIWSRTWVAEVARISDHAARLAAVSAAVEVQSAERAAQSVSLSVARWMFLVLGRGALAGWSRIGGVESALRLDSESQERGAALQSQIERALSDFEICGPKNPSFARRLRGVGRLSEEDCIAYSVTGPARRAAGLATDLRRDSSRLAYGYVDFDIPIGEEGDALDRVLVVVEEIRQSLRIATQCEDRLRELGPGVLQNEAISGPVSIPVGQAACYFEASTGELGFFVVSDGEGLPRRIRCRAPSFFHAQVLPKMLVGERLDDLLPVIASMHIVAPECDR